MRRVVERARLDPHSPTERAVHGRRVDASRGGGGGAGDVRIVPACRGRMRVVGGEVDGAAKTDRVDSRRDIELASSSDNLRWHLFTLDTPRFDNLFTIKVRGH